MGALSPSPHLPYRLLAYPPGVKLSSHLPCGPKHYHAPSSHPCPSVWGFSQCPALAETLGLTSFLCRGSLLQVPRGLLSEVLHCHILPLQPHPSSHCNPIPNGAPTLWLLREARRLWKTLFFVKQKVKHSRWKAWSPRSHLLVLLGPPISNASATKHLRYFSMSEGQCVSPT